MLLTRRRWEIIDRDLPDSDWHRYMKKFGNKYRLFKDDINHWHLQCKFGQVSLYSMIGHQLCFVGDLRSPRHLSGFKRTLVKNSFQHMISQEGDTNIVIAFDEKFLNSMAQTLRIYKKKKISEEQRERLRMQIQKARKMRKSKEDKMEKIVKK